MLDGYLMRKKSLILLILHLNFGKTSGKYSLLFEDKLTNYFGSKGAFLVNSGSSANLLAISALTSSKIGDKRLKPGDEVITVAAGFPTTVFPIIQNSCIPVFIDVDLETHNIDIELVEMAITDKTKAIILAHTLGNPFNLDKITRIASSYNLWLIEDNCDALGSRYDNKLTVSFGDLATLSIYPAHHITTGEGGCVIVNIEISLSIVESFRDWGRDCYCLPGKSNT
ncbi:MAG: DegT/DnrJ/EryC1/StrS family aminotransferase [Candidatus Heimdallarchaeota archaeon]|nr:DegT/DnrJ/EryC1/StrS family aminotransferase [Candidatus Heimdallarchaeota archaeon]MDH5646557.1 DegT/DnrJ/EryC1/StrS family aminotransferase [Candidatus Heimdallarchaeota archaeon]